MSLLETATCQPELSDSFCRLLHFLAVHKMPHPLKLCLPQAVLLSLAYLLHPAPIPRAFCTISALSSHLVSGAKLSFLILFIACFFPALLRVGPPLVTYPLLLSFRSLGSECCVC